MRVRLLLIGLFFCLHGALTLKAQSFKLIGPDGSIYLSDSEGSFGGHKKLKIYGRLDCPSALRWLKKGHYQRHRVFFASESDARAAGYRPCAICMQKEYEKWKLSRKKPANP